MKTFTIFLSISLLLLLSLPSRIEARELSPAEALTRANTNLSRSGLHFDLKPVSIPLECSKRPFYIFNAENRPGFIIVSADDQVVPVLAYCDSGIFDWSLAPNGLKEWLNIISNDISQSLAKGIEIKLAEKDRSEIGPMVQTKWGQNYPYNSKTPILDNEHTKTGCVATALAQIMHYHRWPEGFCSGTNSYAWNEGTLSMDYSQVKFDWDNMLSFYDEGFNALQADAVSQLMSAVGIAYNTNYNIGESGVSSGHPLGSEMRTYFNYPFAQQKHRTDYTAEDWDNLLYNEIANNRPVFYSGFSPISGHAFICDGFKDGLYHVNWGWSGQYDGFYALNYLTPESDIYFAYNGFSSIIVGLCPPDKFTGEPIEESGVIFSHIEKRSDYELLLTIQVNSLDVKATAIKIVSETGETTYKTSDFLYKGKYANTSAYIDQLNSTFILKNSDLSDGLNRIECLYADEKTFDRYQTDAKNWRKGHTPSGYKSSIDIRKENGKIISENYSGYEDAILADCLLPEKIQSDNLYEINFAITSDRLHELFIMPVAEDITTGAIVWKGKETFLNIEEGDTIHFSEQLIIPDAIAGIYNISILNLKTLRNLQSHKKFFFLMGDSSIPTIAEDYVCDFSRFDNTSLRIVGPTKLKSEYVIPSTVNDYKVVEISEYAFQNNNLYTIDLAGVKTIGLYSFSNCPSLESVKAPELEKIEGCAFSNSTALTEIYAPLVTEIYQSAFFLTSLTSINFPKIEKISRFAFSFCKNLKEISFGANIQLIEENAFQSCTNLETVSLATPYPPAVSEKEFSDVRLDKVILRVPNESINAYKAHPLWGKFGKIIALQSSGIDGAVNNESSKVSVVNGSIIISGETHTKIFNVLGHLIYEGSDTIITPNKKGIYIVVSGKQIVKILL